ncbi:hypothetical protein GCM10023200_27150 [Actinomycetospora chlora]|uniref:DUF2231 domain-containing protein n=1 Tax=Actinomycetospora chlora TaxID=663608 RepID=A0ABP9B8J4_9PSEU
MTVINGLPAHVLLVHAVVVLVPLTALLLVVVAAWPAARPRLAGPTAALAVLTLLAVPLTTEAGEWLERRVPASPLVHEHAELGDDLLPWAVGLAVLALVVLGRGLAARRLRSRPDGPAASASEPGGLVVGIVVGAIAVIVAAGAVFAVYRIGESGSRAAWTGRFSPAPIAQQQAPADDDEGQVSGG